MSETVQVVGQSEASPDVVVAKLNEAAEAAAVGHVAATGAFEPDQAENDEPAEQSQATDAMLKDPVKAYLREIGRVPLLSAEDEVELSKWIEAGLFAEEKLVRADEGEIELSEIERVELGQIARAGEQSKDHMIRANLRLVVSIARRNIGIGMSFLDLIQEGNLGMMHAVEKFDYRKGYKFSTYATWWIKQSVSRALHDQGRAVRLPVHVGEKIDKMLRVERKLAAELDREPTLEEIATACEMKPEQVEKLRFINRKVASLDKPLGENENARLGDLIEDTDTPTLDSLVEHNDRRERVRTLLGYLPPREEFIVSMRYGIEDGIPHTLEEIGKRMGMTRERVRQLEAKALRSLGKDGDLHKFADGLRELAS